MNDAGLMAIAGIIGSTATFVGALTWFISGRFLALERKINENRNNANTQWHKFGLRLQRVEIKLGLNNGPR